MAEVRRVLFVCTGNTCRSPLAEAVARAWAQARGVPWAFASAGVSTLPEARASDAARRVAAEIGLDLTTHRARVVARELLEEADLVLALGEAQREYLVHLAPEAAERIHVLRPYASHDKQAGDVHDPIGGDLERYRAMRDEVVDLVQRAMERLALEVRAPQDEGR